MLSPIRQTDDFRMKRAALYLRVSTGEQTIENQSRALHQAAQRHGWRVAEVFKDEGISGSEGIDKRPAFDRLNRAIARREFDLVAAWSVDRLGRSLSDLVAFLGEVRAAGVDLYLHQQGLDTSTPAGKPLFQMLGVFSEFERSTRQGAASAAREGVGMLKIARTFGCGIGTVQRIKAATISRL